MSKSRKRMTAEELAEVEYWQRLRATKNPEDRFRLMLKRAGGQCQAVHGEERCPNRHLEIGVTVKGVVILTPYNLRKPMLHCQKCGFEEVKAELEEPVHGRSARVKPNPFQVEMFA